MLPRWRGRTAGRTHGEHGVFRGGGVVARARPCALNLTSLSMCCASAVVKPLTSGTVTSGGPLETNSVTAAAALDIRVRRPGPDA